MSMVHELEEQLRLAKQNEKFNADLKLFNERKNYYEGKAFASHKLASSKHMSKGIYFTMQKLCNFRENNKESCLSAKYIYDLHRITLNRTKDGNMDSSYVIYIQDALGDINSCSNLYERHIISVSQFDIAFEQAKASKEIEFDAIRSVFKTEDYINGHANTIDSNELSYLRQANVPLIDLTTYTNKGGSNITILELLSWNNHPFVISKHLVNNAISKQITKNLIEKLYEDIRKCGSYSYERGLPRIHLLEDFYISVNWLD